MLKVQAFTLMHGMGLKVDLKTRTRLHLAFVICFPKSECNPTKSIIESTAKNADSAMKLVADAYIKLILLSGSIILNCQIMFPNDFTLVGI